MQLLGFAAVVFGENNGTAPTAAQLGMTGTLDTLNIPVIFADAPTTWRILSLMSNPEVYNLTLLVGRKGSQR